MTAMQSVPQQVSGSDRALLLMLVFGDLFFFSCVGSRYFQAPVKWSHMPEQPVRVALIGEELHLRAPPLRDAGQDQRATVAPLNASAPSGPEPVRRERPSHRLPRLSRRVEAHARVARLAMT